MPCSVCRVEMIASAISTRTGSDNPAVLAFFAIATARSWCGTIASMKARSNGTVWAAEVAELESSPRHPAASRTVPRARAVTSAVTDRFTHIPRRFGGSLFSGTA